MVLKISYADIRCEEVVKFLGIDIDYKLNLVLLSMITDQHISNLCRKADQQLNVLNRLSPFLSKLNKLIIFSKVSLSNFNY